MNREPSKSKVPAPPTDPGSGERRRDLSVDPDIRSARTLPGWIYHSESVGRLQRDAIFARSWQWICDLNRLRAPGHVIPTEILPGCLDEPVVATRDQEGALHCLSNVCTHRGAIVVEGEGHLKSLRCRYHGRRFNLDGGFRSMPEFEGARDFPGPGDDLPALPTGRWGPLLFASVHPDPICSFADWIAPIRARCDWMPLQDARFDADAARDYLIAANWALYCDNYLEELHIPYIHAHSLAGLDYESCRTERFAWGNLQFGIGAPGEPVFDLPPDHPEQGQRVAAFYFWLFPNLMLNFYPWGLSMNIVIPLGPERTRVSFLPFVWNESLRNRGVGGDLHRVEMEDEEVVESQHRGLRSRLYRRGRFSPGREVGTHHFHQLLARAMEEAAPDTFTRAAAEDRLR